MHNSPRTIPGPGSLPGSVCFPKERAAHFTQRRVLTRYLGTVGAVEPQLGVRELQAGDRLLLSSDGLYSSLGGEHLAFLLGQSQEAGELAAHLVAEARESGKHPLDNLTALVALLAG